MNKLALSTFREIKESIGRYLALLLIVGLGVGFFAGLKVTDPAMRKAMHKYLTENEFYDFRLISTLGFEDEDIDYIRDNVDARAVEGSISSDVIIDFNQNGIVVKAINNPSSINKVVLEEGRIPEVDNECLVDSYLFSGEDIGKNLTISSTNDKEDIEKFTYNEYTIVGLAKSPLFIQYERGTTGLGNGVLDGFIYIPRGGFADDYYTDCYIKLNSDPKLYSDEYESLIEENEDKFKAVLESVAQNRYERIIKEAKDELSDAKDELADAKASGLQELEDAKAELDAAKLQLDDAYDTISEYEVLEQQLISGLDEMLVNITLIEQAMTLNPGSVDSNQYNNLIQMYQENTATLYTLQSNLNSARNQYNSGLEDYNMGLKEYEDGLFEYNEKISDAEAEIAEAEEEIADIEEASTYLLGRDTNIGYVCFESDSTIVGSIANVFPVFFFLVAALVCMTTMNRMVEDQRTQIGVLKALGYSNQAIIGKFSFYAGSAAIIGAILGYIVGTIVFPKAIWFAYQMMYNTNELSYYFSPVMIIVCFVVAIICSVGVTILSCRYEMSEMAASLMRPKAPKVGKRIFLEYIPFFWNRLKFLKKVSLRNIFRYKGRLIMMVLGIGGCTALLVAGFGIYDSIANIAVNQFENVSKYDIDITLKNGATDTVSALEKEGFGLDDYLLYYHTSVDMKAGKFTKNVYLNVYEDDAAISNFYDFHTSKDVPIDFNGLKDDEIIINKGLCDRYAIRIGDKITLSSEDLSPTTFTVVAINENFINNFIVMKRSTYENYIGPLPEKKSIFLNLKEDQSAHEISAKLINDKSITSVEATVDLLDRVNNMMKSLNIIVYLVIGSAMLLAAVVVYNLTNINISERIREIATIKVLGFYREETASYVFRENIILSIMGGTFGLALGKVFHRFVMGEVVVDLITFDVRVTPLSYATSFFLTILFTYLINFAMRKKLDNISMTESLKAVE